MHDMFTHLQGIFVGGVVLKDQSDGGDGSCAKH